MSKHGKIIASKCHNLAPGTPTFRYIEECSVGCPSSLSNVYGFNQFYHVAAYPLNKQASIPWI